METLATECRTSAPTSSGHSFGTGALWSDVYDAIVGELAAVYSEAIRTTAGIRSYRVADLAAGMRSVIVGVPYHDGKTPAERDRQRIELRTKG